MRIINIIGSPVVVQTENGQVIVMAGESDVPENVAADLAKVKGQFAEWCGLGLIQITGAPSKLTPKAKPEPIEFVDEDEGPKKKGLFKK